jgi:hypothetical protein
LSEETPAAGDTDLEGSSDDNAFETYASCPRLKPGRCRVRVRLFLQFSVLFLGLAFGAFAWVIQQPRTVPWVQSVFAQHYKPALAAYDLLKSGAPLVPDNPGWHELQDLVYEYAESTSRPPLKSVEFVGFLQFGGASGLTYYAQLRITFETGAPFEVPVSSSTLKSDIEFRLLAKPLFWWALAFLSLGLLIEFVTGLVGLWFPPRANVQHHSPPSKE